MRGAAPGLKNRGLMGCTVVDGGAFGDGAREGVGDLLPLVGGNSMVRFQWQKVPDPVEYMKFAPRYWEG